jgi:prevent-host-death family protein
VPQEEFDMTAPSQLVEPGRVDEPRAAREYSEVLAQVLTQVALDHRPIIVRRNGTDLAAVIPLDHFELLQDLLARLEAERLAGQLDFDQLVKTSPPPQSWFHGDEPNLTVETR